MYVVGVRTKDTDNWAAMSGGLYLFNDQSGTGWLSAAATPHAAAGAGRYYVPLPFGVSTVTWPTSQATYEGRTYYCGGFTYNLLLDENHRLLKQGIRWPEAAPTITGPTGSGNVAYLSWYDELTGERSPLSQGLAIGNTGTRTWSNLPTRPPDDVFYADGLMVDDVDNVILAPTPATRTFYIRPGDRVGFEAADRSYLLVDEIGQGGRIAVDGFGTTAGVGSTVVALPVTRCSHLELWLSVAGGLPQLVMRVGIGTTSVVEAIANADLGESYTGAFERFPRCTMNVVWNDRQLMAGDPDNPDTVYMSDLFHPERYGGLNFKTRTGRPVTGMLSLRDYCLVFTRDQTFLLQGYSEDDFKLSMVEQSLGSIGHLCNAVVHGDAYIWTEKGPYMYNGSWHPLCPENDFTVPDVTSAMWVRGIVDSDANTYTVVSDDIEVFDRYGSLALPGDPLVDVFKNILVFDYTTVQAETGGTLSTARLSVDAQNILNFSEDYTPGFSPTVHHQTYLANKWGVGALYTLSHDGASVINSLDIYPHHKLSTALTGQVAGLASALDTGFWVKTGWNSFDDPGGDFAEGKTFRKLWIDAPAADGASLWLGAGGDPIATGSVEITLPAAVPVAPTVRPTWIQPIRLEFLTGRGLHVIYNAPTLLTGGSFRGFGGNVQ